MNKITRTLSIVLVATSSIFYSCEEIETKPNLNIPSSYDGSNFSSNASTEIAVRTALSSAATEMKKGRVGDQVSSVALLQELSAVLPVATSYYAGLVEGEWVPSLVQASGGGSLVIGQSAGTFGGYLFSEDGIEYEQLIEKGLFGAALYNHAVNLSQAAITEATSDQLLAAFGANPSFPSSNNSSLHDNPDGWMANYTARRDKNDGDGLYSSIKANFIKLQAAANAGDNYQQEQQEAVSEILRLWERANAATVINYLHSTLSGLSSTNLNEATVGSAMHAFSEAIGFLHGFKTITTKTISDEQIDALLTLMNVPPGQEPTTSNILENPIQELPKLIEVINTMQDIYGFTDQEIEDFRKNWVVEQGR